MSIGSESVLPSLSPLLGQISGVTNPNALAPLALRRWCGGLTLASPETIPSFFAVGVWCLSLGALLLLAVLFQGPKRAIVQLFSLPEHLAVIREAMRRVMTANRLFIIAIAATVLSWMGSQAINFGQAQSREALQTRAKDDLALLSKSRSLGELSLEQGAFAAIVPLRDVLGLGSQLPLLMAVTIVLFRTATYRMGTRSDDLSNPPLPLLSGWANLAWASGSLYIIYRLILDGFGETDLPVGGCLMIESFVIPFVMLVCDATLLAFFLVELRDAGAGIEPLEGDQFNTRPVAVLLPAAMLACLVAIPSRYLATTAWLVASSYLPTSVGSTPAGAWLRWLLGRGLTDIQGAGLVLCGIVGVVAWTRGSAFEAIVGFVRLLRAEGARLVVILGLAGLAAGFCAALTYPIVLSLPPAFWLLNAADAYAHLATMAVGLYTLSALVALAERSLPQAAAAESLNQLPNTDLSQAANPAAIPSV